jgi:hypothetical protein
VNPDLKRVLLKADAVFELALQGLRDISGPDPLRRHPGIWNVANYGRSVTFVLQTAKNVVGEDLFGPWYEGQRKWLSEQPGANEWRDLRNEVLKQGPPDIGASIHIDRLRSTDVALLQSFRPPGATTFFVGDQLGGSGWIIQNADGSEDTYYVAMPSTFGDSVRATFHTAQMSDLEGSARMYLDSVKAVLESARSFFASMN